MSSKATKRFVLVPADVYFAEARRNLVGLHSASVLDPSEPKKMIKLSQQGISQEIIEEEKKRRITVGNYQQNNSIEHSRPTQAARIK